MRVAGTPSLCLAGRGENRLLQLHRRLVQPGAAPFRPRLPLAHGLRTCDRRPTNWSVINQARQHSTKTGQLHTLAELALMDLAVRATPAGSEGLGFSLMVSVRNLALFGTDWFGSHLLDEYHFSFDSLV